MSYLTEAQYEEIFDTVSIFSINDKEIENISQYSFSCGVAKEYVTFLNLKAKKLDEMAITKTFVLIHKETKELIGYFSLVADTIRLTPDEKLEAGLESVEFMTLPALKIGKLAINKSLSDKAKRKGYGSFVLDTVNTYAFEMLNIGIACRFITVDADIEYSKEDDENYPPDFYKKNGFVENLSNKSRNAKHTISMRRDIFD